jgi:hypothetical protein
MRLAVILAILCAASVGHADDPKDANVPTSRVVLVAPLTSLGEQDTSATAKKLQIDLEKAVGEVPGTTVIGAKAALAAVKKAKRPELKVCEGDLGCLTELGKLLGAELVIAGEAGGLGDVQVVYLELVDVGKGKGLRSTTLEVGSDNASGGALGAAYRLLAPDRFAGTLTLDIDTPGATIYVDGKRVGKSPAKPIAQYVGTHALRVTHPEYRDFVRFVDVGFDADTRVEVALQQFPIVSTELSGTGDRKPVGNVRYLDKPTPWYRKWWAIAAFSGVVVIGAAATAGVIADGVDADTVRPVNP